MHAHNIDHLEWIHGLPVAQALESLNVSADNGLTETQAASMSAAQPKSKARIYNSTMSCGTLKHDTFVGCADPESGEFSGLSLSLPVIIFWAICLLLSLNIILILILILNILLYIVVGTNFNKSMEKLKNDINSYTFSQRNNNRTVHVRRDYKYQKQFLVTGYIRNNILNDTQRSYVPSDIVGLMAKFVCDELICKKIHPNQLLQGDIVMIRAGDQIYADMRIIECSDCFEVDQKNIDMAVCHHSDFETRYVKKHATICNKYHYIDEENVVENINHDNCEILLVTSNPDHDIDPRKLIKCPNFAFQGCFCINGIALAVVCQMDENTLLNKTRIKDTTQYGMDLNDTYNVFSFHSDKTSIAISKFRFKILAVNLLLVLIALVSYSLSASARMRKRNQFISWNSNMEISIAWLIIQLILVILCVPLFAMRQINIQKFNILESNNMVLNSWIHEYGMEILDAFAIVDVISMNIEELMILKAPDLEKFVNLCNELQIKLLLFDDTYDPDIYYHKLNLDTYGIEYTFAGVDDILRKFNDSNGIVVGSFTKQRTLNIIKLVCESGKTVCQIGNGNVSPLQWGWWKIQEKFVSVLVGNNSANDIARNSANIVCDLDAANGIMAAINAIQQLKQLQQRWYTKLKNTNCLQQE